MLLEEGLQSEGTGTESYACTRESPCTKSRDHESDKEDIPESQQYGEHVLY